MEFSESVMKRILKKYGAKRVSKEAVIRFGEVIERLTGDITEEALGIAYENHRKTLRKEDILKAVS